MRKLPSIEPTPEQLQVVAKNKTGPLIIRGAAGSGKTTTAILRLKGMLGFYANRAERQGVRGINALVLTFNRTLRGYVEALVERVVEQRSDISLDLDTFGGWTFKEMGRPSVIGDDSRRELYLSWGSDISLSDDFLVDEVEYILSRFLPENIGDYVTTTRRGRGTVPRVDKDLRSEILEDVVFPYREYKDNNGLMDWHDLSVQMSKSEPSERYHVVVCDEVQDFSANQIRAINNYLSEDHSLTLVIDGAQKIYSSRAFRWKDVGLNIRPENTVRLKDNHRNTKEIAKLAQPLVEGLDLTDDATIPDFNSCYRSGPKPVVLVGRYSSQMKYTIDFIDSLNLDEETVSYLHPSGWFKHTKLVLRDNDLEFVELTRRKEWPTGPENIALSTLHSAKGLEFDHVIIIGLNGEVTQQWEHDEKDIRLVTQRKLLAMGIGRAKQTVTLGYKESDPSRLINYLDEESYSQTTL